MLEFAITAPSMTHENDLDETPLTSSKMGLQGHDMFGTENQAY